MLNMSSTLAIVVCFLHLGRLFLILMLLLVTLLLLLLLLLLPSMCGGRHKVQRRKSAVSITAAMLRL